ncbi:MAG: hypothetical protein AMXMBFR58_11380 [Phycisphaerae bacterium]
MLFNHIAAASMQPIDAAVSLPDSLKLARLVDLTSEITAQAFSYNQQDLNAVTVTLRVPGGLNPGNLPVLLDHVLASRGFTTVRTPGSPVLSVVKLEQAAGLSRVSDPGEAGSVIGPGYVTELIEARHQPARTLVEAAKLALSKPGGAATVLGESRLIAVSDLAPRVAEVRALLARLDVPSQVVTREIALTHISAAQLVALATQVVAKRDVVGGGGASGGGGGGKLAGDLIPTTDGGSVLLVCPPEVEGQWRELIVTLDRREPIETRTYTPTFYEAKDLATLVETIGATPTRGAGVVDERFRVVVNDLTGSLIVTATASQHDRIADLVNRADSQERVPTPVRTYAIKNRPVAEVLQTIQQLVSAGVITSAPQTEREAVTAGASQSTYRTPFPPPTATIRDPASVVNQSSPGGTTTVLPRVESNLGPQESSRVGAGPGGARGGGGLSLTSDESTNTLIAIGEPRVLDQIEALLKTIDVRQPQVMLEVMLVSLSDTEALSLGVEIERIGSINNAVTQLSSLFGLTGGSAGNRTVPDQAGFTGAVLNAGEFAVVVRALESINKGNSISNPKLLVTNNQRAVFSSTLQQPITQQTRTGSNDTTFSYGGSESAGTTISVQPQIAQGDHLALTYSIKLSNFVGTSTTAGLPPPKQENSVDSSATIPDGYTVVVGGMELITDSEAVAQVPILGSIPIIGELFKSRDTGNGRTRFYVFIRANVLRSGMLEDLKYLSAQDLRKVGELGVKVSDGFPEVRARVIR